jgi:hypothetical protein
MDQPQCEGCQQVLGEVKALRDEVTALRGLLVQDIASRRFSWRRWFRRLFIAYAIFALYVLSCGPAAFLADKWEPASDIVDVFYLPLEMLCEVAPILEPPLSAYISLWTPAPPQQGPPNAPAPVPSPAPDPAGEDDN